MQVQRLRQIVEATKLVVAGAIFATAGAVLSQTITAAAPGVLGEVAPLDELRASDRFWGPVTRYHHPTNNFQSLHEITDYSHLIVRGRVLKVTNGDFVPFEPLDESERISIVVATVAVEDVLKGSVVSRVPGTIEVALDPTWDGWEEATANVPSHDHLFFLMNEAELRRESGFADLDPDNSSFRYWRPNGDQAVLRDIGGSVAIIEPEPDRYPLSLQGVSFASLIADVRARQSEVSRAD